MNEFALDPSQERAVDLVCAPDGPRIAIVTGGPGCGKTTSLRVALDRLEERGAIVRLAAPTGKAAKRMNEATGRATSTVHRLLEFYGRGFRRNRSNPIDARLVVVDEASMLDVELASALFASIRGGTRLVLVGDADQLPSVGPGRVFADLIDSGKVPVARLTTLHRVAAESWVCSQAPRILRGDLPDLRERADFRWIEQDDRDAAREALVELVARTLPAQGIVGADAQVLVPQRVGPAGADVLNGRLQALLNPTTPGTGWRVGKQELCVGDRVIQTRNDYTRSVFNGEVGVVAELDPRALVVDFGDPETGRRVTYDREAVNSLQLAYALSVHKSQGSEWPWVVCFVHTTHTRMLTRQLFYTAITRARKGVIIVGDRAGIERATANVSDTRRNTALIERLRGEIAA